MKVTQNSKNRIYTFKDSFQSKIPREVASVYVDVKEYSKTVSLNIRVIKEKDNNKKFIQVGEN